MIVLIFALALFCVIIDYVVVFLNIIYYFLLFNIYLIVFLDYFIIFECVSFLLTFLKF